jgi:hypothetical protein
VVVEGRTGLLGDERNIHELENHVRWLIAYPERWRSMLIAGRKHIE